jgi:hypothetical protein
MGSISLGSSSSGSMTVFAQSGDTILNQNSVSVGIGRSWSITGIAPNENVSGSVWVKSGDVITCQSILSSIGGVTGSIELFNEIT